MIENKIDAKTLESRAFASPDGESYFSMDLDPRFSMGICARRTDSGKIEFFIDLVIPLCRDGDEVDTAYMERVLIFINTLKINRYGIVCDEGVALCEKTIRPSDIDGESSSVKKLWKMINDNK